MGAREVARPHDGGEPVRRAVRDRDRLLLGVEGSDRDDRSEDLLLVRAALRRKPGDDGRLHEPTPLATRVRWFGGLTAGEELAPLLPRQLQVAEDLLVVRAGHDGALLGPF